MRSLYPLYPDETRTVRLEVEKDGQWKEIATEEVNDLGWSALFRVENWDATRMCLTGSGMGKRPCTRA